MISMEDLYKEEDPLELFHMSSRAIEERRSEIEELSEIRTRAVAALYAQGASYRDLARLLALSTPRVGQMVNLTDARAIEILKAWVQIEALLADVAAFVSNDGRSKGVAHVISALRGVPGLSPELIDSLSTVRRARNDIVHGRFELDDSGAEEILNLAVYVSAGLTVWLHDQGLSRRAEPVSPGEQSRNPGIDLVRRTEIERRHEELAPRVRVKFQTDVHPQTGRQQLWAVLANESNRTYSVHVTGHWSGAGRTDLGYFRLDPLADTRVHVSHGLHNSPGRIVLEFRADEWDVQCPCGRPDDYGHWTSSRAVAIPRFRNSG